MEGLLQIFCNHQANDWAEWLAVVQYIINSRPSSITKKAPYELWMGHIPQAHQAVKDLKVPDLVARQKTLETISVTSTAGCRQKVFGLLYTMDLYIRDPIGITF